MTNSYKTSLLAVVGIGALGSEVCRILAQTNHSRVVLIDPDRIEARNLAYSRMLLLGYELTTAAGLVEPYKVTAAIKAAEHISGQQGWIARPIEIADVETSLLAECALIFSCTDNIAARCETNWIARRLGKGVMDGGLKNEPEQQGRVSWFPARRESACYLCQLTEDRRAEILQYALALSLGCMAQPSSVPMDASAAMTSWIARQMVAKGMQILDERRAYEEGQTAYDDRSRAWCYGKSGSEINCDEISLSRSLTCPWHEKAEEGMFISAQPEEIILVLLQKIAARDVIPRRMVLELQWPVCLHARCTACGAEHHLAQRLGLLRQRAICMVCGASNCFDAIEIVRTIGEDSPYATKMLKEIGFSTEQIFCIRPEFHQEITLPE
jgi:hypothetical protein